jgi:serine/threonine protein kinase
VLSGAPGRTRKAGQRFRRNGEAAAKLHHTNIVPVYATGEEGGTHCYAMELIGGPSLDGVIRQLRGGPDGDTPTGLHTSATDFRPVFHREYQSILHFHQLHHTKHSKISTWL